MRRLGRLELHRGTVAIRPTRKGLDANATSSMTAIFATFARLSRNLHRGCSLPVVGGLSPLAGDGCLTGF
jgi:hypothetical protein